MQPARFEDRFDAGRRLAAPLARHRGSDAVVLALPRGGVPVAYEVARALGLPLDVYVVRKLGLPSQPELAMGAIAGSTRVLNEEVMRAGGVDEETLERVTARETAELERQEHAYRAGREPIQLDGRRAILVDDGLATGSTMLALRRRRAVRSRARQTSWCACALRPCSSPSAAGTRTSARRATGRCAACSRRRRPHACPPSARCAARRATGIGSAGAWSAQAGRRGVCPSVVPPAMAATPPRAPSPVCSSSAAALPPRSHGRRWCSIAGSAGSRPAGGGCANASAASGAARMSARAKTPWDRC